MRAYFVEQRDEEVREAEALGNPRAGHEIPNVSGRYPGSAWFRCLETSSSKRAQTEEDSQLTVGSTSGKHITHFKMWTNISDSSKLTLEGKLKTLKLTDDKRSKIRGKSIKHPL
eukprot:GHVP01047419.1.p1 GENE.GHVP01047419.1~~GHVP01047419.1.p1  ORF type:complete len:114 (+),score=15.66 GHVP01047419.1:136-477(+)